MLPFTLSTTPPLLKAVHKFDFNDNESRKLEQIAQLHKDSDLKQLKFFKKYMKIRWKKNDAKNKSSNFDKYHLKLPKSTQQYSKRSQPFSKTKVLEPKT